MALKDWKKLNYNYRVKDWIRYKNLHYVGLTIEISKNTDKNKWIVYQNNRDYITILKENFKTKTQALQFAKAFMRKH